MRSALVSCLLVLLHVAFLATAAFGAPCQQRCPDDGPDGRCPPVCAACACAPRSARPGPVAAVAAPSPRAEILAAPMMRASSEPDPQEIAHVPKRLLASS
jgi:hypothetical protein